ncbi:TadE/TadG family type IV pilus assembly protein [Sphingomonas sp.]|uniref:TadE/TadG family type IV pilus assembly protein n=1 Tax=Sphingomonas sp. TaxID=28214 RepID=UPI002FC8D602
MTRLGAMTRAGRSLRVPGSTLRDDSRGATIVEFGLVLPVMALLIMGAYDVGHTLYATTTIQGAVQKATRDSGLETASVAQQAIIDARVTKQVKFLAKDANITITRRNFRSFAAATNVMEQYTDTNNNGTCDNNEPYDDDNRNGTRDQAGTSGQGGAKDAVLYTVVATYPRMFPLAGMIGVAPTTTVKASTILSNQPYGDQVQAAVGHCNP